MGPFKSTFILFAYLISRAVSAPNALQGAPPPKTPTFEWAALGDSWASGVTYSGDKDNYDDDKNCLRLEDAYSVQMKKDKSWTVNDQNFHFVACSGAQLFDIAKAPNNQLSKAGEPHLITMTIGGNNVGFFNIAKNCIYHQEFNHDYGKSFDDDDIDHPSGECAKAMQFTRDYINDVGRLRLDMVRTLNDIYISSQAKSHGNAASDGFYVYLTGYAHYWDTHYTDWCDNYSFGIYPWDQPKLTKKLRHAMNDFTSKFNTVYENIANTYPPPPHMNLDYVDISPGFDDHRFCEGDKSSDQFGPNDDTVWFWNRPTILPTNNADKGQILNIQSGGGGNDPKNGNLMRPFHPKSAGHGAIKDQILKKLRANKVPGVK